MTAELPRFLAEVAIVSLSGVLAPGPVMAATLAHGSRSRHAGAWIAIGHGVVEFPLMGLIMLGAGTLFKTQGFKIGVGLAGGVVLLFMAGLMLASLRRPNTDKQAVKAASPLWTGIVLTGGNPYFLLWWATVGLALATKATQLGLIAFALFAIVHWLGDLIWLEILSVFSHKGVGLMGPRVQVGLLIVCSLTMLGFGLYFALDAIRSLV